MTNERKLTWTTKPNTTRADSDVGGYWITWTQYPGWPQGEHWCNGYAMVDGSERSIAAGKKDQVKDACDLHYANVSQMPVCANLEALGTTSRSGQVNGRGKDSKPVIASNNPRTSQSNSSEEQK